MIKKVVTVLFIVMSLIATVMWLLTKTDLVDSDALEGGVRFVKSRPDNRPPLPSIGKTHQGGSKPAELLVPSLSEGKKSLLLPPMPIEPPPIPDVSPPMPAIPPEMPSVLPPLPAAPPPLP